MSHSRWREEKERRESRRLITGIVYILTEDDARCGVLQVRDESKVGGTAQISRLVTVDICCWLMLAPPRIDRRHYLGVWICSGVKRKEIRKLGVETAR